MNGVICVFVKPIKVLLTLVIMIALFFTAIFPAAALDIQRPASVVPAQDNIALPHIAASKMSFSIPFFNTSLRDLRLQTSKNYGVNGVNRILNALDLAKNQVQGSKLQENEKAAVISEINANITWFETKKNAIQSATDVATVKSIGNNVNDRWNIEKVAVKKQVADIACDQYDVNIAQARNASSIAAEKISSVKAQGKNTAAMEQKLASYNNHVNNAAKDLGNARDEFDKINGPALTDVHFSVGLRQLKLADKEMNNSYVDLKSLYSMIYRNGTTVVP